MKHWLGAIMGKMEITGSRYNGVTLITSTTDDIDLSDNIMQAWEIE